MLSCGQTRLRLEMFERTVRAAATVPTASCGSAKVATSPADVTWRLAAWPKIQAQSVDKRVHAAMPHALWWRNRTSNF